MKTEKFKVRLYGALIPVHGVSEGNFQQHKNSKESWAMEWFRKAHSQVREALANNFCNGVQWCYYNLCKNETTAIKLHQDIKDYCEKTPDIQISEIENELMFCSHPQVQFNRVFYVSGISDIKELENFFIEFNPEYEAKKAFFISKV